LLDWARGLGQVAAFGVEGTGCYGAGLARFLGAQGQVVVEVNRPDRQARRRRGKSDPVDAEAAARAVLARQATAIPKTGDSMVEMVRCLRVARATAMKAWSSPQRQDTSVERRMSAWKTDSQGTGASSPASLNAMRWSWSAPVAGRSP
jgi:hypothetical protein